MAVFDESKVINALHKTEAKAGKKYWFANNIFSLKDMIENNIFSTVSTLKEILVGTEPFVLHNGGGMIKYSLLYPYEEPEKKLVPFTWEDREQLRGKWVRRLSENGEVEMQIKEFRQTKDKFLINCSSAKLLLQEFTFLDGSPCGKESEQ